MTEASGPVVTLASWSHSYTHSRSVGYLVRGRVKVRARRGLRGRLTASGLGSGLGLAVASGTRR